MILQVVNLEKFKKVHFIGIGGIGISAIARMMLLQGKGVTGSDRDFSVITNGLKKLKAQVYKGHKASNLDKDIDLVVYTTAIPLSNPEIKKAEKLKIPILSYPEALSLISKDKYTIAISGTHGKTTATAILAKILIDTKKDPTVIVGSLMKEKQSNLVVGKSDLFLCEACEYKRAFLNLNPKIIVITNIDKDHLDYYKDLKDIQKAFSQFVSKLGRDDFLVCNIKDKNLKSVIKKAKCKVIDYFNIKATFNLKVPGVHNVENAKAAMVVAGILKVSKKQVIKSLENFNGVWRRFEYKGKTKEGVLVYDDYAHHPTEIQFALRGAREKFKKKKIWCVFQPHLFSRTKLLLKDFAKSFNEVDDVIVSRIYAAREKDDGIINGEKLVNKINKNSKNALYLGSFKKIEKFLRKNIQKGDVVITVGAGDIFKVGESLLK